MTTRQVCLVGLLVALFSLWLRAGVPIQAMAEARFDDALFIELARHLGAGHWLGPFDNRTLVKGMAYPAFILLAQASGIPLKLAEHLVYLAACWLVAWLILRRGRAVLALLAFAALALNPVVWTAELSRVIREGLYLGLSLAVAGLLCAAVFAPTRRLAWGCLAGLAAGAFWLTREEGVWLLPSLLVILAGAALHRPRHVAAPALLAIGVAASMVAAVAAMNARHYGAFEDNEVKSAPFRHAYGALSRITPDHWQRFVVFPRDARLRAYAASPAARELAPTFDGPTGEAWRRAGCDQTGLSPCQEILAGWFQWALRDAVAAAGHYGSASDAAAYYDRLGREIDAACDTGAIACGPPRASLAPPFRLSFLTDALAEAPDLLPMAFQAGGRSVVAFASPGRALRNALFADMVGPLAPTGPRWLVQGRAEAAGSPPTLMLRASDGGGFGISLDTWPIPPANGLSSIGFELETDCPPARCELIARAPDGATLVAPLAPARLARPGLTLAVDVASPSALDGATRHRRAVVGRVTRAIAAAYASVLPIAGGLGALGVALALARRRADARLLTLALASAAAVAARIAVLAYLDVTAIPSANILYASPATPFAILFAALGCGLGLDAIRPRNPQDGLPVA